MERVIHLRDALRNIAGALKDPAEVEHRARGEIAVLQEPAGEVQSAYAALDIEEAAAEREHGIGTEPLIVAELPPEIEWDGATPLISMEGAEEIRTRVSAEGIEALGCYVTFHQTTYQWGAYVSADGLRFLADPIHGIFGRLNISPRRRIELACHAILRHELMHFAVDYMASQWEIATGSRCFWPARSARDPSLGYAPLEEELANTYMLRGFRFPPALLREPGVYRVLCDFVSIMPPGYRDAVKNKGRLAFEAVLEKQSCHLENFLTRTYRTPFPEGFNHLSLYPPLRPVDWRYCAILLDSGAGAIPLSLRIITSINMIDESAKFKRSMRRMDATVRRGWDRAKEKLRISTQIPGLDFKPWEQDVFSVRINDAVRAHLRIIRETGEWIAEAIGPHKEMGHG
jgi:hypothetical protein